MNQKIITALLLPCVLILTCYLFFKSDFSLTPYKKKWRYSPYDYDCFLTLCKEAAQNEEKFAHFRKAPLYSLVWENLLFTEGAEELQAIQTRYPELLKEVEKFRTSDAVGNPQVFDYGPVGSFSPTTLHNIKIAGELREKFGSLDGLDIVEIGGGYGGLCKILSDLHRYKSYTIIDLPECLELAENFLEKHQIKNVVLLTPDQLSDAMKFDLAISKYSFSECGRTFQKTYIKKILSRSEKGYLVCAICPRHFGVCPLSKEALSKEMKAHRIPIEIGAETPQLGQDHFTIHWKGNDDL